MRGIKNPISEETEAVRSATKDEAAAYEFMETRRWNGSPKCPFCGSEAVYRMTAKGGQEREKNFRWRCRPNLGGTTPGCGKMFSVRTGTVMESSRLPLRHWVRTFWRACESKKGVAALQIQRELDINYKSALFMLNRVRLAMAEWGGPTGTGIETADADRLGRDGGAVEADETYVGGKPRPGNNEGRKPGRGTSKTPVFCVVARGSRVRMRVMPGIGGTKHRLTARTLGSVVKECVDGSAQRGIGKRLVYCEPESPTGT